MRCSLGIRALLLVAPLLGASAQAQMMMNNQGTFTPSAEVRIRGYAEMNPTGNKDNAENNEYFTQRTKVGLNYKLDTVSAQITLLNASTWGQTYSATAVSSQGNTSDFVPDGAGSLTVGPNSENLLLIHDAYLLWTPSKSWMFRLGRQHFNAGDGKMNVAFNDWFQVPFGADGLLAGYIQDAFSVYGTYLQGAEYGKAPYTASGATGDTQNVSYSLTFNLLKRPDWWKMLYLYAFHKDKNQVPGGSAPSVTSTGLGAGESYTRYFVSTQFMFGPIDLNAHYGTHMGDYGLAGTKYKREGSMYQVEAGFNMPELMKFRVYGLYHSDTGTKAGSTKNKTYDGFFYDRHSQAGLMDILAFGNLTYYSIGVTASPMEKTSFGLHFHQFSKTEKTATGVSLDSPAFFSQSSPTRLGTSVGTSDDLGQEIDLSVEHKLEAGIDVNGIVGMFMPGDAFDTGTASTSYKDTITQVMVQVSKSF